VRVSDKAYYVSPTRGQLGNALKCVYAASYVADGERGEVEVTTGGTTHRIVVTLDRIGQRPVLDHTTSPEGHVKTGTEVALRWRQVAGLLARPGIDDSYTAASLLRRFALFNPHASFHLLAPGAPPVAFNGTEPRWTKWRPTHPTSPHWYTAERLRALLAAYIVTDRDAGRTSRTVREVVAEFAGLSGSAKQKAVTDAAGLTGARLEDIVRGEDLDRTKVAGLLAAMRAESRPVKPKALGMLGAGHLAAHLVAHWDITEESIKYVKKHAVVRGVPVTVETVFGIRSDRTKRRELPVGLNFSPVLRTETFVALSPLVAVNRIDAHDPVVLAAHVACPVVRFADRGKAALAFDMGAEEAGGASADE